MAHGRKAEKHSCCVKWGSGISLQMVLRLVLKTKALTQERLSLDYRRLPGDRNKSLDLPSKLNTVRVRARLVRSPIMSTIVHGMHKMCKHNRENRAERRNCSEIASILR